MAKKRIIATPAPRVSQAPRMSVPRGLYHCGSCGMLFGGIVGFDRHRVGEFGVTGTKGRHCLTTARLKGLTKLRPDDAGVWRFPDPTKARETLTPKG